MKLEKYINEIRRVRKPLYTHEQLAQMVFDTVLPTLKKECSEFIGNSKDKTTLYRGVSDDLKDVWRKEKPRTDRKPLDTPRDIHNLFDGASQKIFKWKARSQGVFTSPRKSVAGGYGTAYLFLPCNGYKYIWSPEIIDFYDKWKQDISQDPARYDKDYWNDIILHYYQNYHLSKNETNEVMFYCPNGYYLIDSRIDYTVEQELKL